MNTLQENKIPVKLNFRWRLDGENNDYIIYGHPVTGMLDILNPVATDIFIKCDGKHTIGEIANQMMEEYKGVTRSTLLDDIYAFIQHMIDERVFFVVE